MHPFYQEICCNEENIPLASLFLFLCSSSIFFQPLFIFLLQFWRNARGVLIQACALSTVGVFFTIIIIIILLSQTEQGMKWHFFPTSSAHTQTSCHMHSSILHQGRKYLDCRQGQQKGAHYALFFCEIKLRTWKKVGQGGKEFNSCQGDSTEFERALSQLPNSSWQHHQHWANSCTSVICYKCSTRAVFNSVFCFDLVVLMKDTAGKCVIHICRLSCLTQQWYSPRYHHCLSTSSAGGWCCYLYWRHLIAAPGRRKKKSGLCWLNFPLEKHR